MLSTFFAIAASLLASNIHPTALSAQMYRADKTDYLAWGQLYCAAKAEGISMQQFVRVASQQSLKQSPPVEFHQALGEMVSISVVAADKSLCPGPTPRKFNLSVPSTKI